MSDLNPDFAGMTDEQIAAHHARTEEAMRANGVSTETVIEEDYFGFDETKRWYFPNGVFYIEYKAMTEGMRRAYQKKTNHSVRLQRASGDAIMGVDPAGDREALIDISVVDWFIKKDGQPVTFKNSQFGFHMWIKNANPKFVESLERAIRQANPWMAAEMKSEDIRTEIDRLEEQFEEAVKREAVESTFLTK